MKQAFKDYFFRVAQQRKLVEINRVIYRYQVKGYQLTLRQLYYQLVAAGVIKNTIKEYENLVYLVNRGRLAGEIDWMAITDRSRLLSGQEHSTSPKQALTALAATYRIDKWKTQENYVEIWIEKEALLDIIGEVAADLDVHYMSSRGYFSTSALYEASLRFKAKAQAGKQSHVLYLGDHDPSGIDMMRDIEDRLLMFGSGVQFKTIGLTQEQIELYKLPPSPAKISDSRYSSYVAKFGKQSWELDALGPEIIQDITRRQVLNLRDDEAYREREAKELKGKQLLMVKGEI